LKLHTGEITDIKTNPARRHIKYALLKYNTANSQPKMPKVQRAGGGVPPRGKAIKWCGALKDLEALENLFKHIS